jgi:hypothetical protein
MIYESLIFYLFPTRHGKVPDMLRSCASIGIRASEHCYPLAVPNTHEGKRMVVSLEWVAPLLDDLRGNFALQGYTVDQVVAQVVAQAR